MRIAALCRASHAHESRLRRSRAERPGSACLPRDTCRDREVGVREATYKAHSKVGDPAKRRLVRPNKLFDVAGMVRASLCCSGVSASVSRPKTRVKSDFRRILRAQQAETAAHTGSREEKEVAAGVCNSACALGTAAANHPDIFTCYVYLRVSCQYCCIAK